MALSPADLTGTTIDDTPLEDSIEYRLKVLTRYLQDHGFRFPIQFIHADKVLWSNLHVGGHSQGSGMAAYLAKNFGVEHACILAGIHDIHDNVNNPPRNVSADWLLKSGTQTPVQNQKAVLCNDDPSVAGFKWGLSFLGLQEGTNYSVTSFSGGYFDEDGNSIDAHSAVVLDPRFKNLRDAACFGSPVSIDPSTLAFGQVCPVNSTCTYNGYNVENANQSMACASGQALSVIKSSYWGDDQKAFGTWSNCHSYLYNNCENYSSCSIIFNNLWCAGDPDMNHAKNATVVVSCAPGSGTGTGNYDATPDGIMLSSNGISQDSPYLTSDSTNHFLALNGNGNVILSDQAYVGKQKQQMTKQIWQNGVNVALNRLPYLSLGTDGVLFERGKYGALIWNSNTWATTSGGAGLVMQNDGNLVVYDLLGNALWSSGTGGK